VTAKGSLGLGRCSPRSVASPGPAWPKPSNSHPLQARNSQQPQPQLEGVGAEAAEGQAGAAGGLKHGLTVDEASGPQGRDHPHALNPVLNRAPSKPFARRVRRSAGHRCF